MAKTAEPQGVNIENLPDSKPEEKPVKKWSVHELLARKEAQLARVRGKLRDFHAEKADLEKKLKDSEKAAAKPEEKSGSTSVKSAEKDDGLFSFFKDLLGD